MVDYSNLQTQFQSMQHMLKIKEIDYKTVLSKKEHKIKNLEKKIATMSKDKLKTKKKFVAFQNKMEKNKETIDLGMNTSVLKLELEQTKKMIGSMKEIHQEELMKKDEQIQKIRKDNNTNAKNQNDNNIINKNFKKFSSSLPINVTNLHNKIINLEAENEELKKEMKMDPSQLYKKIQNLKNENLNYREQIYDKKLKLKALQKEKEEKFKYGNKNDINGVRLQEYRRPMGNLKMPALEKEEEKKEEDKKSDIVIL